MLFFQNYRATKTFKRIILYLDYILYEHFFAFVIFVIR